MALTKIKTQSINDNAITNAKMADDAIDSADLADGSIDNVHLAGSIAVSKTLLSAGTGLTLSTNTLNVDAAQTQITSVGTLTSLTVDNISVNGTTIGHTSDTDLLTFADAKLTTTGELEIKNGASRRISLNYEDSTNSIISHSGTSYGLESLNIRGDSITFYTDYDSGTPKGNQTLNLDNSHNATFSGTVFVPEYIKHDGDTNTSLRFLPDNVVTYAGGNNCIDVGTSEVAINHDQQDINFRVESDSDDYALFVDAGNSRVGINTGSPSEAFHVVGDMQITNTHPEIKFTDSDDNSDGRIYHSAGNMLIDVDRNDEVGSSYFRIGIDDKERLRIDSSGNVIIPNTTAAGNNSQSLPGYLSFQGYGWDSNSGSDAIEGRITFAGRNGSYGRFVEIKHLNNFKTRYAHLYKFSKGIKKGKVVKQGDIIGFVGTSGRSTGPHLHYEVKHKNRTINPIKLRLESTINVEEEDMSNFYANISLTRERFLATEFEDTETAGNY